MIGLGMIKKITIIASIVSLLAIAFPLAPAVVQAQNPAQRACDGVGGTWDPGEGTCSSGGQDSDIGSIFKTIANVLLLIIGSVAVIMLIIGGIRYVVSAGDSNALQGAKNTILYAIIGIVVAFMAFAAVNFVIGQLDSGGSGAPGTPGVGPPPATPTPTPTSPHQPETQ